MSAFAKSAAATGSVLVLVAGLAGWYARDLPTVSELRQLQSQRMQEGLNWVPLSEISPRLQAAALVSEDVAFYQHRGFNFVELGSALVEDIHAGCYRRGGSTITQQVAKCLLSTHEKTLRRKLKEAILAHRLEQAFSKDEILEIYLNLADWGDGAEGAGAAARLYLDKSVANLTWADAALLVGMLPNPRRFSPAQSCDQALRRRDTVLAKLQANGDISSREFAQALMAECPQTIGLKRTRRTILKPVLLSCYSSALRTTPFHHRDSRLHGREF